MQRLFLLLSAFALLAPQTAEAGQKPIVRILSVTAGTHAKATLTVLTGPVDLADLAITDFESEPFPLSATSKTLATGATVTLAWDGAAGAIPVTGHALPWTDDELAVLLKDAIIDAVVWTNGDGERADAETKDVAVLVTEKQWKGDAQSAAVLVESGQTMTRKSPTTDTDTKDDWTAGESAPSSTPSSTPGGGLPTSGPADVVFLGLCGYCLVRCLRRLLAEHDLIRP